MSKFPLQMSKFLPQMSKFPLSMSKFPLQMSKFPPQMSKFPLQMSKFLLKMSRFPLKTLKSTPMGVDFKIGGRILKFGAEPEPWLSNPRSQIPRAHDSKCPDAQIGRSRKKAPKSYFPDIWQIALASPSHPQNSFQNRSPKLQK